MEMFRFIKREVHPSGNSVLSLEDIEAAQKSITKAIDTNYISVEVQFLYF